MTGSRSRSRVVGHVCVSLARACQARIVVVAGMIRLQGMVVGAMQGEWMEGKG